MLLCIMLACLMLLTALLNAVCFYNAYLFFAIYFCNAFCFYALSGLFTQLVYVKFYLASYAVPLIGWFS